MRETNHIQKYNTYDHGYLYDYDNYDYKKEIITVPNLENLKGYAMHPMMYGHYRMHRARNTDPISKKEG